MRRIVILWIALIHASVAVANDGILYTLDNVRLGQLEGRTRVVFDISGPAEYQVVKLSDPPRVVLKISKTAMKTALAEMPLANTPITNIHATSEGNSTLHVVLDLANEVEYKYFFLKPNGPKGDRLVLDLYPRASDWQDEVEASAGQAATVPASGETKADDSRFTFSGTWEQEWAFETDGGDSQKFEALIEPRLDISLAKNTSLTAIARIRLDTDGELGPGANKADNYSSINGPFANDSQVEFSLRELYLDTEWGNSYWRLGKQQVVWGQADGIKVLDVVNPQSFREFILDDFDDSRIPLAMVNMQMPVGDDVTLQLLWIPDTTYHELAEFDTPYFITSPKLVPVVPKGLEVDIQGPDVPDNLLDDSDVGSRLSAFIGGWDVTVNYLYHYQDFPVYYQRLELGPIGARGVVSPEYERNHLAGGTLSNAFGDFTLRAELAYSTDTFHVSNDISSHGIENSAELASVVGLDWQLGAYDTLLSVQWFQSHLFDYHSSIHRDQTEHNVSFYYQRDFAHETWQFDTLALYSLDNEDSLIQLKLKYLWRSNIELWLGADIFSGDREGLYGQFKDLDRMLLGLKLGF